MICWEKCITYFFHQYLNFEKTIIDNKDIWKGLAHFRIARNFTDINNLNTKKEFIDLIQLSINHSHQFDERYIFLLEKFYIRFNKTLLSATSKILWLMDDKENYVILDTLAINTLEKYLGKINETGVEKYFAYKKKWYSFFNDELDNINRSIKNTYNFYANSKNFNNHDELEELNQKWFKMRVFDMFLWNPN